MVKVKESPFTDLIDYDSYTDKKLLLIPLALLAFACFVIIGWYLATGSPVTLGVAFAGGTSIQVVPADSVENPEQQLQTSFDTEPTSIQSVPSDDSYIVTFRGDIETKKIIDQARQSGFTVESSSQISPSIGSGLQKVALMALLTSFVGMSVVVFLLFRTLIPSLAVVLSALSDILVPIAVMNLLGISLSLGTVAALLMLLGYSVDSDMLLTNHVLRRRGGFYESVKRAMDTGVTMTIASMSAMIIMAAGGFIIGIPLLFEIGIVLTFGLATDLINTYLMNVSILRRYKLGEVGA